MQEQKKQTRKYIGYDTEGKKVKCMALYPGRVRYIYSS